MFLSRVFFITILLVSARVCNIVVKVHYCLNKWSFVFENKIMSVTENVQKKDTFYIILLKDGLVTVPKQWLTNDKKFTFWPSNVNAVQQINLIKSCAEVDIQWKKYEIEFIYGTAETYKRARKKEKLAEKVSDINTTTDEEENKRKRKLRSKKIYSSDSEDDASVVATLPKKNKPQPQLTYPKPPSSKATSAASVMRNMDDIEKGKSDSDNYFEEENDMNKKSSNSSGSLQNTNYSYEKNVAYNTSKEATEDKNFKRYVVQSLVDITNRVKKCESLLKKKQNNSSEENLENQVVNDIENILDERFPMKSLDNVKDIEQQLKHDETFKKQIISALYLSSQSSMKKTVSSIMKILFTDEVAAKFS